MMTTVCTFIMNGGGAKKWMITSPGENFERASDVGSQETMYLSSLRTHRLCHVQVY